MPSPPGIGLRPRRSPSSRTPQEVARPPRAPRAPRRGRARCRPCRPPPGPTSNCGLISATRIGAGAGQRQRRRQRLGERDEGQVGDDPVRRRHVRRPSGRGRSSPRSACSRGSARSAGASWPCPTSTAQTSAAPRLEQHLAEAAGRGAEVERHRARRVEPEGVERVHELQRRRARPRACGSPPSASRAPGRRPLAAGRAAGRRRPAPPRPRSAPAPAPGSARARAATSARSSRGLTCRPCAGRLTLRSYSSSNAHRILHALSCVGFDPVFVNHCAHRALAHSAARLMKPPDWRFQNRA